MEIGKVPGTQGQEFSVLPGGVNGGQAMEQLPGILRLTPRPEVGQENMPSLVSSSTIVPSLPLSSVSVTLRASYSLP